MSMHYVYLVEAWFWAPGSIPILAGIYGSLEEARKYNPDEFELHVPMEITRWPFGREINEDKDFKIFDFPGHRRPQPGVDF